MPLIQIQTVLEILRRLNDKLKKQLSYANKKAIQYVVIIGPEEFKEKKCIIKNMISGEQLTLLLKDLYLKLKEKLKV